MSVCATCGGDGWVVEVETEIHAEAGCCGNYTRHGECCGDPIAVPVEVPVQVQVTCDACNGSGRPAPAPTTKGGE